MGNGVEIIEVRIARLNGRSQAWAGAVAFASTVLLGLSSKPVLAAPTTLEGLLEKAQIEDLINDFYSEGLNGKVNNQHRSFGSFFTEDGKVDINGTVAQGRKAIDAVYARIPEKKGTWDMMYTNPRIVIKGDTATVDVIWGYVGSDSIKDPPRWDETGREHDDLVKRDGQWLIKFRWITSDAGLSPTFERTYKPR